MTMVSPISTNESLYLGRERPSQNERNHASRVKAGASKSSGDQDECQTSTGI